MARWGLKLMALAPVRAQELTGHMQQEQEQEH